MFSLSRLRLEVEAADGNLSAPRIPAWREDPASMVQPDFQDGLPGFSRLGGLPEDPLLQLTAASDRCRVVSVGRNEQSRMLLDRDGCVRCVCLSGDAEYCKDMRRPSDMSLFSIGTEVETVW